MRGGGRGGKGTDHEILYRHIYSPLVLPVAHPDGGRVARGSVLEDLRICNDRKLDEAEVHALVGLLNMMPLY
jgi:hypothetical protein